MRCGVTLSSLPDRDSFFSNSGNPEHTIFSPTIEDGRIHLIASGKENTDIIIQSYADQCDMSIIISRLAAGDTSVLNARPSFYGDMCDFPNSRAEFLQSVIDARAVFDNLSADVKAKFDNDFKVWYTSAGQPDWVANMQPVHSDVSNSVSSNSDEIVKDGASNE